MRQKIRHWEKKMLSQAIFGMTLIRGGGKKAPLNCTLGDRILAAVVVDVVVVVVS